MDFLSSARWSPSLHKLERYFFFIFFLSDFAFASLLVQCLLVKILFLQNPMFAIRSRSLLARYSLLTPKSSKITLLVLIRNYVLPIVIRT